MEELVQQLIKQVGLDPKQAQQVIGLVTGFLKDKLPADMLEQVSGLVGGLGDVAGDAAGAATGAAKDVAGAADDVASAAGDKADDAAGGIMAKLGGLFGGDSK